MPIPPPKKKKKKLQYLELARNKLESVNFHNERKEKDLKDYLKK